VRWYIARVADMPYVLLASIVVLAVWTVWILRSGRAGRWAQAIPVVAGVVAGALQLAAMHAIQQTLAGVAEANPANKASNLADGIGRASAFAVGAWTVIAAASLLLVVLTLRKPQDLPAARVV
jgi:hypothetical protein